jgi:site-specific recombinase XerD
MPKQLRPKVIFFIDTGNKNKLKQAPIKANITFKGKSLTKIIDHCLESDWNTTSQTVKPARPGKDNNHESINKKLVNLKKEFEVFAYDCEAGKIELNPDLIRKFLNGARSVSGKPFWEAYEEYLTVKIIEPKTKQNYTLYRTKLQEFEKEKEYRIDYHTINTAFFDLYKTYILTEKKLSWNTLATAIKKLKFFMNWSLDKRYHNENGYKDISITEKESTVIFLSMEELTKLYQYNFDSPRLNQTRDKFCFGCFTGLAFSDLDGLTFEHINNGTLTKYRQKTKIKLDIELPDPAVEIIKRYSNKYKALPKLSHQKLNKYIKECCKIAGIDTPTIYKDFSKGITTEQIKAKHELIGSHNARKTFISNFYNMTKDINLTKQNAGITQDKTLRRYMGSNKEMEREAMKKAFGNIRFTEEKKEQ